jgi:outer membrane protein
MKFKLTILALLIGFLSFGQSKKWSLRECIDYAIENNISIKQAQLDAESANEDITSSKGNFLPNLNGSASHSYNFGSFIGQDGGRISSDSRGNSFGLNTGVTLFNGFRNTLLYEQSKLGLESSQIQLDILRNDISLNVANQYLNVLLNKEALKIAQEQIQVTQQQLDQIKELVDSGVRPRADLFDIESQLASNQESLVNAHNNVELALLGLAQLMQISHDGFDVQEVSIDITSFSFEYDDVNMIYNIAIGKRPEIRRAELNIKNSELGVDLAKSSFYPSLSLGGGLGTSYQHAIGEKDVRLILNNNGTPNDPSDDFPETIPNGFGKQLKNNLNYNLGFSLSIPIFNRFQTKVSVSKAKINNEKSLLSMEQEKQTLRTNIERAYADAKASLNQYLASEASVKAQDEAFSNAQDSYDLGALTSFELEQVRNRLVNAQSSLINAKYNFIFKTKVLDFYMGKVITLD